MLNQTIFGELDSSKGIFQKRKCERSELLFYKLIQSKNADKNLYEAIENNLCIYNTRNI